MDLEAMKKRAQIWAAHTDGHAITDLAKANLSLVAEVERLRAEVESPAAHASCWQTIRDQEAKIEAALAIAEQGGSHRKVEQMVKALTGGREE